MEDFDPDPQRPVGRQLVAEYRHLIIDGGGLATTAWSTHKDQETAQQRINATVYVFVTSLASLSRLVEPGAKITVAWDGYDNRAWRRGRHPWYKHGRGSVINRAEVREAISIVDQLLAAIGASSIVVDGREADDVVATIATRDGTHENPCLIFSDDKDYIQLICDSIHLCRRSLQGVILTPDQCDIMAVPYGLRYLHQKAMMGDSGDNIRGLPGIGEVKALELLGLYPEAMIDPYAINWDTVPKSLRSAFVRAGRRLIAPYDLEDAEFVRSKSTVPVFNYDLPDSVCLEFAMREALCALDLVTLDCEMALPPIVERAPNIESIPAIMRKFNLDRETDLYASLYSLAGARSSRSDPPRTSATRAGAAIR